MITVIVSNVIVVDNYYSDIVRHMRKLFFNVPIYYPFIQMNFLQLPFIFEWCDQVLTSIRSLLRYENGN